MNTTQSKQQRRQLHLIVATAVLICTSGVGNAQDIDYSTLEWKVGAAKEVNSLSFPLARAGDNETLTPSEGRKLVVVPISWSVRSGKEASGRITVGNLYFLAVREGDVPRAGAAISMGEVETGLISRGMWMVPKPGELKTLVHDIAKKPKYTFAVAFVVPINWDSFEVRFAYPIGSSKADKK